jgi:hypothetical protein
VKHRGLVMKALVVVALGGTALGRPAVAAASVVGCEVCSTDCDMPSADCNSVCHIQTDITFCGQQSCEDEDGNWYPWDISC